MWESVAGLIRKEGRFGKARLSRPRGGDGDAMKMDGSVWKCDGGTIEERMSKCCEKQEDIDGRRRERKEGRGGRQLIGLDKWRSSVRPGSGGNALGKSRCVVIGAGLYVESGGDWQAVGRVFGV